MAHPSRRRRGARFCKYPQMDHRDFWRSAIACLPGYASPCDWQAHRRSRRRGLEGSRRDHAGPSHPPRCATRSSWKSLPDVPGRDGENDRNRAHTPRQNGPSAPRSIWSEREKRIGGLKGGWTSPGANPDRRECARRKCRARRRRWCARLPAMPAIRYRASSIPQNGRSHRYRRHARSGRRPRPRRNVP